MLTWYEKIFYEQLDESPLEIKLDNADEVIKSNLININLSAPYSKARVRAMGIFGDIGQAFWDFTKAIGRIFKGIFGYFANKLKLLTGTVFVGTATLLQTIIESINWALGPFILGAGMGLLLMQ